MLYLRRLDLGLGLSKTISPAFRRTFCCWTVEQEPERRRCAQRQPQCADARHALRGFHRPPPRRARSHPCFEGNGDVDLRLGRCACRSERASGAVRSVGCAIALILTETQERANCQGLTNDQNFPDESTKSAEYRETRDEIHLVQPDAVAVSAGRLPGKEPLGVGRHRLEAVRPGEEPRGLQHLYGPAGIRGDAGLRRHRRERASPERLRHHAVSEHHRGGARAAHQGRGPCRARQFDRALQSAGARGGGVRDARLHLGRAAGRGLSRRHVDGHQLLLRPDPGADAREICRGARSYSPRWSEEKPFAFNGRYNKPAPCEHLAAGRFRIRCRCIFPAAVLSRPTTSVSTTPIRIRTCRSAVTSAARR